MCENQVGDAGIIHQVNLFYICMQICRIIMCIIFFSFYLFIFFSPSSFLVLSVDSIYICV